MNPRNAERLENCTISQLKRLAHFGLEVSELLAKDGFAHADDLPTDCETVTAVAKLCRPGKLSRIEFTKLPDPDGIRLDELLLAPSKYRGINLEEIKGHDLQAARADLNVLRPENVPPERVTRALPIKDLGDALAGFHGPVASLMEVGWQPLNTAQVCWKLAGKTPSSGSITSELFVVLGEHWERNDKAKFVRTTSPTSRPKSEHGLAPDPIPVERRWLTLEFVERRGWVADLLTAEQIALRGKVRPWMALFSKPK